MTMFKLKKGMCFNVYESPTPNFPWLGSMSCKDRDEADMWNLEGSWMQLQKKPEERAIRVGVVRVKKVKKRK